MYIYNSACMSQYSEYSTPFKSQYDNDSSLSHDYSMLDKSAQHASQSRQVVWYTYFSQAVSSSQRRLQSMRYQSCRFPKELRVNLKVRRGWTAVEREHGRLVFGKHACCKGTLCTSSWSVRFRTVEIVSRHATEGQAIMQSEGIHNCQYMSLPELSTINTHA